MGKNKLVKYELNKNSDNVFEEEKPFYSACKGNWGKDFFKNDNPIILELACGNGEYTTGLAEIFPEKNFIGIDIKGARLAAGSKIAQQKNLQNVAFLRTYIQNLEDFFEKNEISEIWIVQPDPRPRGRDTHRRLTHPRFLGIYKNICKENGIIRFKTDNPPLFEYTLEVLATEKIKNLVSTTDLYSSELEKEHFGIKTKYEIAFAKKGFTTNYLRFQFES